MSKKESLAQIASLSRHDVGHKEENVKQKIAVPLLELLGHTKNDLDFEHATKGKEIDIFIKGLPTDCKVVIDTKKYDEDLNSHMEQIKDYTISEGALLAVLANGTEIQIYSPLKGIAFERSLLYSFRREDLLKDWKTLKNLLGRKSLETGEVYNYVLDREKAVRKAVHREDSLEENYLTKETKVKQEIESLEGKLSAKRSILEQLEERKRASINQVWQDLGLLPPSPPEEVTYKPTKPKKKESVEKRPSGQKAKRVTFQELVEAGLLRNNEKLYFYHTKHFKDEAAEVVTDSNRLRYLRDGKLYSVSTLAHILLRRHGFFKTKHSVAGPLFWMTRDGRLLNDLNEEIRRKRGDRK